MYSPQSSTITTCRDAPSTGIFQLKLPTLSPTAPAPITVLCGVTLAHGTWLVIQQRFDGSVDFNRNWTEYRNGFGAMASFGEFWLGLEPISQITRSGGEFELMVELKNEAGEYGWARYDRFEVDGEGGKYQLAELGDYGGTMGDCMGNSGGMKFTTVDSDNDNWSRNCAQHYLGGWWYNSCVFKWVFVGVFVCKRLISWCLLSVTSTDCSNRNLADTESTGMAGPKLQRTAE